jgi:hypothetical protein
VIRTWTCPKCGYDKWPRKYSKCHTPGCTGRRRKSPPPKHREIMAVPYERWVEQFGELCGICGAKPKNGRRLNRDHSHREPYGARGLLCANCNRHLHYWATVDWLLNAAKYLDRTPITRL